MASRLWACMKTKLKRVPAMISKSLDAKTRSFIKKITKNQKIDQYGENMNIFFNFGFKLSVSKGISMYSDDHPLWVAMKIGGLRLSQNPRHQRLDLYRVREHPWKRSFTIPLGGEGYRFSFSFKANLRIHQTFFWAFHLWDAWKPWTFNHYLSTLCIVKMIYIIVMQTLDKCTSRIQHNKKFAFLIWV